MLAQLEVQGQHQQGSDHPGEEHDHAGQPGAVGPVGEDAGLDERCRGPRRLRPAAPHDQQPGGYHAGRRSSGTSRAASPPPGPGSAGRRAGPSRPRTSTVPTRPSWARRPRRAGFWHDPRGADRRGDRPSGRLTKKMSRQPVPKASGSTRAPPMIGPSTADSPMTGPKTAKARPCSAGAKTSRDDPEALRDQQRGGGPCASRQPISMAGADRRGRGQRGGDEARRARPRTGACGRTCRPAWPPVIRPTAKASAYPPMTHCSAAALACRSVLIVGAATFTIDAVEQVHALGGQDQGQDRPTCAGCPVAASWPHVVPHLSEYFERFRTMFVDSVLEHCSTLSAMDAVKPQTGSARRTPPGRASPAAPPRVARRRPRPGAADAVRRR